jgi:hypothetical protein
MVSQTRTNLSLIRQAPGCSPSMRCHLKYVCYNTCHPSVPLTLSKLQESTYAAPLGPAYTYDSPRAILLEQVKSLRLLEVLPGNTMNPITCRLRTYPLELCPTYKALSYCWGDSSDTLTILVEGRILAVTSNLRSALRHSRHNMVSRMLRADACCIN